MSLRPHEQRILVDVEDQLSRDDPALADLLAPNPPTTARRDYFRPSALTVTPRSAASMGLPTRARTTAVTIKSSAPAATSTRHARAAPG